MSKDRALRTGAGPKFLLSGLLRCAECGSTLAIAGRDVYCCSGHTNGGTSLGKNDALLPRQRTEFEVLKGIKRELRSPVVIKEICRRARAALNAPKPKAPDSAPRIAQLKAEIGNIADAIASGVLRASPTLANRLSAAEAELKHLETAAQEATAPKADITRLLADLSGRARRAVDRLEETLAAGDVTRARQEIRDHVGIVTVEADGREIRLYSEQARIAAAVLRATGTHASLCGSGGRI